ncbi:MAG TPA: hypothetical protein VMH39_07775, partial [Gemmatimonadaceae bacterium]|nr:hypothetical protein [Gemmatimonadaceae bacterium]
PLYLISYDIIDKNKTDEGPLLTGSEGMGAVRCPYSEWLYESSDEALTVAKEVNKALSKGGLCGARAGAWPGPSPAGVRRRVVLYSSYCVILLNVLSSPTVPTPTDPLPKVGVIAMTDTAAESHAIADVLAPGVETRSTPSKGMSG